MAVARMMRHGAFDSHLRALRTEHAKRCTQMIAAIQRHMPPGSIRFARPAGGLYLWCRLGPGLSATALHERALAAGVTFVPGPAFYPDPAGDSELRLCFTSVLPATAEESIRRLARCVGEVRLTA
jgi:DNA-binding transcriptional MocR family regulator